MRSHATNSPPHATACDRMRLEAGRMRGKIWTAFFPNLDRTGTVFHDPRVPSEFVAATNPPQQQQLLRELRAALLQLVGIQLGGPTANQKVLIERSQLKEANWGQQEEEGPVSSHF